MWFFNRNPCLFVRTCIETTIWVEKKFTSNNSYEIYFLCYIHDFSKCWMIQRRVKISYLGLYWQGASGKVISYLYLWYIQLKLWPWMDCLLFPQFILIDKHMQRCCPPPPRVKLPTEPSAPNNHRARAQYSILEYDNAIFICLLNSGIKNTFF